MGSINTSAPIKGIFQIPVFGPGPPQPPSERGYQVPPKFHKTLSRAYTLHDFRDQVFGSGDHGISPTSPCGKFLSKNGFTAVKYPSVMFTSPYTRDDFDSVKNMDEIYYPEIADLVKKVTGCKTVITSMSSLRGPPRGKEASNGDAKRAHSRTDASGIDMHKPVHKVDPGPCLRAPHNDSTLRGSRSFIRFQNEEIYQACADAGIIEAEDAICARAGLKAMDNGSDAVLAKEYNAGGMPGPRYATFSIWRPLKRVTRDPLALAPRWQFEQAGAQKEVLDWPYENRNMGQWGDWIRELTMLRVKEGTDLEKEAKPVEIPSLSGLRHFPPDDQTRCVAASEDEAIKFYYLSEMENDEVLVVKLSDSASPGKDAPEADGPFHGSPDLGEFAYGDDRESLEVRLLAVW